MGKDKAKNTIQKRLFEMQDLPYRDFQCNLMPTVPRELVIGIRVPMVRKYAKELAKEMQEGTEAYSFFQTLPHHYYEENNLHAFMLEQIKDFDQCVKALDAFLPYVDNWSTCDSMKPKVFSKHLEELLVHIKRWIVSDQTYTARFAIEMLMSFYLGDNFKTEYADMVASVRLENYYAKMMVAWYFATALAKNYDQVIPYIREHRLEPWTNNKSIQKAIESYRITDEQKTYLRTLKL